MISYNRFWDTMRRAGESTYTLTKHHRISSSTIDKLRRDKPITTTTINDLCRILDCVWRISWNTSPHRKIRNSDRTRLGAVSFAL